MKNTVLLASFLFVVTCPAFSQATVELFNSPSIAAPKGYSHAAIVDLGTCKMVIMSGQVAFDKQGNLIGKDDLEKQTEQIFQNIKAIVTETGGTMDNLVKLGYFTTDVSKIGAIRSVRDKFINTKNPPASTLVQVSKLFRDDVLIEIEATAVIPKK
jgi:2-iminobutanoate/2-iminopropanoate deaminase